MLGEIVAALGTELRSMTWRGARGLEAAEAAASVTLATLAALAIPSDNPWWAAITAFMATRASQSATISRSLMRITGSIVGAVAALIALRLFVYQSLPFLLCLFVFSAVGSIGFVTSRYGYAWLIGTITACLIMLMCFDQPYSAFDTAVNRVADVAIGIAASFVVCALSPLAGGPAAAAPALLAPPPLAFWRRNYGIEFGRWLPANGALIMHACRGGLTVMLMPALAEWIAPVSPLTMGVTAVMVMAIPPTAIVNYDTGAIVARALHRFIGCLLGALVGIGLLAFVADDFWLWLALIPLGIWICSQIQNGTTGISYIGTQAMFAYVMSMIQGQGRRGRSLRALSAWSAS
ncbi:MAG: FUSC family protein [Alphaproteobacteria bacterium]|nr:FUSC family protein [Alphaproteobacteria bacterium]